MPKKKDDKRAMKVIAAALVGTAAGFAVLNAGYLGARLSFAFRGPRPIANAPAAPPSVPEEKPGVVPEWTMAPDRLVIASLGLDAPLVYVDGTSEAEFQLALRDGVVHYPGTAMPGERGNAYYFGHSSDYAWAKGNYKTVFATLTEIEIGARIVVSDRGGRGYEYEVRETRVIAPKDLSVLAQGDGSRAMLTLQTSYPVGTALKRFVVIAELVE